MKHLLRFILLPFLLQISASAAEPKDSFEIKPAVLDSDGADKLLGALRWEGKWELAPETAADRLVRFHAETKGTIATEARGHGENMSAEINGMYFRNFDPPPVTEDAPEPGTRPPSTNFPPPTVPAGFGGIEVGLAAAFEADQPWDNRQWTAGLKLNYTKANAGWLSHALVPFVSVDYVYVSETSATLNGVSTPTNRYGRLGLALDWQLPIGTWLAPDSTWKSIRLVPQLQYHRSDDARLSANGADLADAYYTAVALDIPLPREWRRVSAVRITWADGRIPPATESRTTFDVAVVVKIGRK